MYIDAVHLEIIMILPTKHERIAVYFKRHVCELVAFIANERAGNWTLGTNVGTSQQNSTRTRLISKVLA